MRTSRLAIGTSCFFGSALLTALQAFAQPPTPRFETVPVSTQEANFIPLFLFSCQINETNETKIAYGFKVSGCLDCPFRNTSNTKCKDFGIEEWQATEIVVYKTSFVAAMSSKDKRNRVIAVRLYSDKVGYSFGTISGVLVFPQSNLDLSRKPVFLWQMLRTGDVANVELDDIDRDGLLDVAITFASIPVGTELVLTKDIYSLKGLKEVPLLVGTQTAQTLYGMVLLDWAMVVFGFSYTLANERFLSFEGLSLPILEFEAWSFSNKFYTEPDQSSWNIVIVGDLGDGMANILECPPSEDVGSDEQDEVESRSEGCAIGFVPGEVPLELRKFLLDTEQISKEILTFLGTPKEHRNIALLPRMLSLARRACEHGLGQASLMLSEWAWQILGRTGFWGGAIGALIGLPALLGEMRRVKSVLVNERFGQQVDVGDEFVWHLATTCVPIVGLVREIYYKTDSLIFDFLQSFRSDAQG